MNLEKLMTGDTICGDSGNDPKALPDWIDLDRFKRGQQFFQCHIAAAVFALHCSLTVGFGISNLVQPLAFTKKSDTAPKALLRYLKTFAHVVLWHTEDVWDENTLGHKSTQTVREMHSAVRMAMGSENPGKRFLSQYDMALVQSGFMSAVVSYPSGFGIACTKQELDDYLFFWRGIGYLLGIRDEFNVCSGSYEETCSLFKEIEQKFLNRCVIDPPAEYETLSNAYINGVNRLLKFRLYTKESIIALVFKIVGDNRPNLKLTWSDYLRITLYQLYVTLLRWMPGFEMVLNFIHFEGVRKILPLTEKELASKHALRLRDLNQNSLISSTVVN